jgi:hypothetical protein
MLSESAVFAPWLAKGALGHMRMQRQRWAEARRSLATLVSGGATIGDIEAGDCADCGADAVEERVGPGPGPEGKEGDDAAAAAEIAPVSSKTSLSETALPEKNSAAEREGSIEGAGETMSDWNESDFLVRVLRRVSWSLLLLCGGKGRAYFAQDDERDWARWRSSSACTLLRSRILRC